MVTDVLSEDMDDLSTAEDFLDYFEVPYDPQVVHVNRLHILQRFHDYIAEGGDTPGGEGEGSEADVRRAYGAALTRAYQDFVVSTAQQEKVFKVFHMNAPQKTFVSAADLLQTE